MSRLIDADALRADYFVTSTTTNTPLYRYVSMDQIANAPTVEPASPWHMVEDKLPDIGKLVLVWDAGSCWLATRTDDEVCQGRRYWKKADEYGEWDRIEEDMYWMPIEPPKEDEYGDK